MRCGDEYSSVTQKEVFCRSCRESLDCWPIGYWECLPTDESIRNDLAEHMDKVRLRGYGFIATKTWRRI